VEGGAKAHHKSPVALNEHTGASHHQPLLCSLDVGGSTMPRGPLIPQMPTPITGNARISTAQPALVPGDFVVRQTLAMAHKSTSRTTTAIPIQKNVSSNFHLPGLIKQRVLQLISQFQQVVPHYPDPA